MNSSGMARSSGEFIVNHEIRIASNSGNHFLKSFSRKCNVSGTTTLVPEGSGNDFFLVVSHDEVAEGSYGVDSQDNPREPATGACYDQGQAVECN